MLKPGLGEIYIIYIICGLSNPQYKHYHLRCKCKQFFKYETKILNMF